MLTSGCPFPQGSDVVDLRQWPGHWDFSELLQGECDWQPLTSRKRIFLEAQIGCCLLPWTHLGSWGHRLFCMEA